MTEFQNAILEYVKGRQSATTWEIAQDVFPEKWAHRSGRGALIGHIDRAGGAMPQLVRLPAKHQHDSVVFVYSTRS